jgi:hypothetical protein
MAHFNQNLRPQQNADNCLRSELTARTGRRCLFAKRGSGRSRLTQSFESERLLWPITCLSCCVGDRQVIGLCRHWSGLGSTSAMWRIADGGGIEQRDSGFLHQRTHTLDPLPTLDRRQPRRLFLACCAHSTPRLRKDFRQIKHVLGSLPVGATILWTACLNACGLRERLYRR